VDVAVVGLLDARGWLLLQERDEYAPVEPEKWGMVGGGVEPGEDPVAAARRELEEETGVVRDDLVLLGSWELPCQLHVTDQVALFTARTSLTDDDIDCTEGRQIVFVDPAVVADLDLTGTTRTLYPLVLRDQAGADG
jgi:8-oxo-dGTP diphosphatase